MYQIFIKPILYWLNIETAHRLVILVLRIAGRLPFFRALLRSIYRVDHPSLEREVFGLRFRNPVGVAAGFDVSGEITSELGAIGFGFVEVGAITPEPQLGNPKPRIFRLPEDRALINRLGHPNRGWAYAISRLRGRGSDVVVGCNIARNNNTPHSGAAKEYLKCFRNLYQYVDYFTVNIDYKYFAFESEQTPKERMVDLLTPLFEFRRGQSDFRPILIKVLADLDDDTLDMISEVLIETPLDGVVAVSGTSSRDSLKSTATAIEGIGKGRLTGAPLRERALEVVRRIHTNTGGAYPIIGAGGIMSAEDARAMLEAGASLVQLYTGLVYEGPSLAGDICRGLIASEASVKDNQGGEISEENN